MSGRNTRKDPSRPATRSNYVATPAVGQSKDATLPLGLHDADPLGDNHPRILESSRRPNDRDTESSKDARDAGPPGGWVDDPNTPILRWDTGASQDTQDAGPTGT